MEEQREGRRERFCLDMEAQEADGQVDLGVKQMDLYVKPKGANNSAY